ncbi:phosphoribosyltransferase [Sphingomonas oleivorans]|uniref:Phosphoribosyltransferase n=1 Tax=Sphingomonas oleivorans TaxID=1735121 RepID=A0A2T5G2B5_9SPHN|nr:phosphoribosyltransferase family protein [Sphingomonas oleivorans]PTQ13284.1 phosphoribosyltransferase [Sphingomonas oleivorans]
MMFTDRAEAGRLLAERLGGIALDRPVVLALPRGGIPVAAVVATALDAPLDIMFVRKIGAPFHAEYAIGAVVDGANPQVVLNEEVLAHIPVDKGYIMRARDRELAEIERRRTLYRGDRPPLDVAGRTVIVIDDGVATGATVRAALLGLERSGASRIILAVPVISAQTARQFRAEGIEVVAVLEPRDFMAVGQFYRDFRQLRDEEVIDQLRTAWAAEGPEPRPAGSMLP